MHELFGNGVMGQIGAMQWGDKKGQQKGATTWKGPILLALVGLATTQWHTTSKGERCVRVCVCVCVWGGAMHAGIHSASLANHTVSW